MTDASDPRREPPPATSETPATPATSAATPAEPVSRAQAALPDDVVRLDAAQLKALAHPLRSRLIGALRFEGPSTATALAARLGTNSGATSYHLRQLAEVGLVAEDAELCDGRSRYWRSLHRGSSFNDLDFREDPDDRAASEWLQRAQVRHQERWAQNWLDTREEWPESWRRHADLSDLRLELTAEQLGELVAELHAVVERARTLNAPDAPGTEHVHVAMVAFPYTRPPL